MIISEVLDLIKEVVEGLSFIYNKVQDLKENHKKYIDVLQRSEKLFKAQEDKTKYLNKWLDDQKDDQKKKDFESSNDWGYYCDSIKTYKDYIYEHKGKIKNSLHILERVWERFHREPHRILKLTDIGNNVKENWYHSKDYLIRLFPEQKSLLEEVVFKPDTVSYVPGVMSVLMDVGGKSSLDGGGGDNPGSSFSLSSETSEEPKPKKPKLKPKVG